jgi:hypothetical protein
MLTSVLALGLAFAAPPAKTVAPLAAPTPVLPTRWVEPAAAGFRFADGLHAALQSNDVQAASLTVGLPGHGDVRLNLTRFEPVAPDARVEVGVDTRAPSKALSEALRGVVHFQGTVAGADHSSCYIAFGTTGAAGWINLGEPGELYTMRRVGSDEAGLCAGTLEFVRSSGTSAPDVPACGGAHEHDEGGAAGFGAVPPGVVKVVDFAIDCDFDFYRIFPSATAATEYVSSLFGAGATIYRRDCDATLRVAYLRLQDNAADLFNENDPLVPFRDYWNANGGSITRDLFTLLTGRRNLPYGGVAYLNATCGNFGYSVNGYLNGTFVDPVATSPGNWDINVTTHEFGHNLGTRHTHDYAIDSCASGTVQRGTIMSYCHVVSGASSNIDLRFHRGTAEAIESFIATAPCLSSDCNGNGLDDAVEIDASPALDSNGDGILDSCQDCNGNGTPDPIDVLGGAPDANGNGRPDSCERDCDGNGTLDAIEIALDPAKDVDGDMNLDACQLDCNANGVADAVEILADMTLDRSRDGRLDACEDCDGDGTVDFAELQGSKSRWVGSSADNLIRELDPRSGVVRRTYACGTVPVSDLAIGADGRLYAAAGNRVYVLNRSVDTAASPWSVVLSADARALAVAPNGGMAVLLANGRIDILNATGQISSTFVQPFTTTDAQDIVFRTVAGLPPIALVSRANGVIRRFSWPTAASGTFADLSALAPGLRGMFVLDDGSVLVAASALNQILKLDPNGVNFGEWDVDNNALVNSVYAICDAGDGRGVLATGTTSSSTINGFNKATGYTERTYRVYPADAPSATAIVVAPASATDADGNLIPDACEAVPGDLDGNGVVNGADLTLLLNAWGTCSGCPADLNGDGSVGAADLAILLNAWT